MQQKKILIIEDSTTVSTMLKFTLTEEGFNATLAKDCAEGIKQAQEVLPDMVLIDTHLPDGTGFEVCQKIRSSHLTPDQKIIIMSATIKLVDAVAAKESGADDYCIKEGNMSELIDTIKKTL